MPDEKKSEERTITLHFEETVSYAVPIRTTLTDDELAEFYSEHDKWFPLVEEVENWHSKCCTAVLSRELEAIYNDEGEGF